MKFRPMLAHNEEVDLTKIKYPILASTKLDGIRCIFMDGKMLSRSLKPIPNKQLQAKFKTLADYSKEYNIILDGELYGEGMTFQEITHFVMTQDLDDPKNIKKVGHPETVPDKLKFYCFDCVDKLDFNMEFINRLQEVEEMSYYDDIVEVVEQEAVHSKEAVLKYFEDVLERGYEGLILKSYECPYKRGRCTFREGFMFKVKPYQTFDAPIIGIEERYMNTSESYINELGKQQKHNLKEAMKPTGIAGSLIVDYNGETQKIALTGDEHFRREIWVNRNNYIGKWIEYKGMLVGSKDRVRHPTFVRFREDKNE